MDRDDQLTTQAQTLIKLDEIDALFARHVKASELPEFYKLQERNQDRVRMLIVAMDIIARAPTLGLGYKRASQACGGGQGESADTMRRTYDKWRKSRSDWRSLVNGALEWSPTPEMPKEFIEELQDRVDKNNRSEQAAIKALRSDWAKGVSIPGYGTWREWWMRINPGRQLPRHFPGKYPDGWGIRNLRRKLDESKFRRVAQTRGLTQAKKFRPSVRLSRIGSAPGRQLFFDDKEHDYFVNTFEHKQAARPLEIYAHDYAAAYKTFFGIRPKIKDEAGFVKKLTGDMMRLVVAGHYWTHGYHPEGTINYAEHGTACFTEDMCRALYDDTEGLVTVETSGWDGRAAHAGVYHGRSRGQPGHKAPLESNNNLEHNMLAELPGQTGRNVEERPEMLHGMLTNNANLLAAWEWLPVEFRDMLEMPLMELTRFRLKLNEIYHNIACERDHDVTDWIECGNVAQMLEFGGGFMTLDDIKAKPKDVQQKALALLQSGLLETRPVMMSRYEVWQRGRSILRPIHGGTVCRLLGENFAREVTVRNHEMCVSDEWAGSEPVHYFGSITTLEGAREELREGQTYQGFVNPFAPEWLFIRNAKGRFLGQAKRQPRASRLDPEAVSAAVRELAKEEGHLISKLIGRQVKNIEARRNRHKTNIAALKKHESAQGRTTQAQKDFTRKATAALNASLPENAESSTTKPRAFDARHDF